MFSLLAKRLDSHTFFKEGLILRMHEKASAGGDSCRVHVLHAPHLSIEYGSGVRRDAFAPFTVAHKLQSTSFGHTMPDGAGRCHSCSSQCNWLSNAMRLRLATPPPSVPGEPQQSSRCKDKVRLLVLTWPSPTETVAFAAKEAARLVVARPLYTALLKRNPT